MPSPEEHPVPGRDGAALPRFHKTGERLIHRGWVVSTVNATFEAPDGHEFDRDIIRHPGAVAVVPVTADGCVLLVHQYRPAVERWLLEIPAGTRDAPGEPLEETARRELAEEVGRTAGRLVLLTRCLNTPGFCDEETAVFLATDLGETDHDRQGVEEGYLTVEQVPLDRFDELVDDGTVVDAATVLGVALARRRLADGP